MDKDTGLSFLGTLNDQTPSCFVLVPKPCIIIVGNSVSSRIENEDQVSTANGLALAEHDNFDFDLERDRISSSYTNATMLPEENNDHILNFNDTLEKDFGLTPEK
jgi:hypothetical protein